MEISAENLRFILGLKLRQLRTGQSLSLKDLAAKTGLSISYLSEIEKGKKYPKPEKLIQIARALGVPFDTLVSARIDDSLNPVTALLESDIIREFPFELFGIEPQDILNLITDSPHEAGALIRTLLEIGRSYDMGVEHFLFAALRSYQKMHNNYFEDLESASHDFRAEQGWATKHNIPLARLKSVLKEEFGIEVDETTLLRYPDLKGFRSIWIEGTPPKLLINPRLLPSQKGFQMGREIGYRRLNLKEHTVTSSWLRVDSFEKVLNNFKASYFSGALLIDRDLLRQELTKFFRNQRWSADSFLNILRRFNATPEMFAYRLSQLLPGLFGLQEMFYLRFSHEAGSGQFQLTKELNMSRVLAPHGIGLNEHYCRRWLSIKLLKELASRHKATGKELLLAGAQRMLFMDGNVEFFAMTLARPLVLTEKTHTSIMLGFLLNDTFRETIRFWDDPAIAKVLVHETCERCGLPDAECSDRVVPPVIFRKEQNQNAREKALDQLFHDLR